MDYPAIILRMSLAEIRNFLRYAPLEQLSEIYHHEAAGDIAKHAVQCQVANSLHVDYIQGRDPMKAAYAYLNPEDEAPAIRCLRRFAELLKKYATDDFTYLEDMDGQALTELYNDVVEVLAEESENAPITY